VEFVVDVVVRDPLAPDLPLPEVPVLYEDESLCANRQARRVGGAPIGRQVGDRAQRSRAGRWRDSGSCLRRTKRRAAPASCIASTATPSGVMVVAKTQVAFEFLRAQFKARTVQKEYRCLVFGEPRFQSDWIERPIATDPRHADRMTVVEEGGRESSTFYEVVERFQGFAHVRCRPKTGRTHQIRVHMTAIGHSLVGDRVYRSRLRQHDVLPDGAPDPQRQCLHAHRLVLPHPATHETIEFEAPLPADMRDLLVWLRSNRAAAR
jgi:23S rRNA pseudouridine1911/1915/1917 synthase